MNKRKLALVRMLERAVDLVFSPARDDISGLEPDRSEVEARKILKKLKLLAKKDPDNKFGRYFARLQLKLFRHLGLPQ